MEDQAVDIELAANSFIAGMYAQELGMDGRETAQLFVGLLLETRGEMNSFEGVRDSVAALADARRRLVEARTIKGSANAKA